MDTLPLPILVTLRVPALHLDIPVAGRVLGCRTVPMDITEIISTGTTASETITTPAPAGVLGLDTEDGGGVWAGHGLSIRPHVRGDTVAGIGAIAHIP